MLILKVPASEQWDENNQCSIYGDDYTLQLEHSLISLSKWEAKWKKPFISKGNLSNEEILDYIKCMTITQNVPEDVYLRLTLDNYTEVRKYIEDPMTATWFSNTEKKGKINNEQITAELIYYWMIALQIPFECQKWHLNRLITLIRVCNIKNTPPKKMSRTEIARRNAELNAKRRAELNTKG